MNNQTSSLPDVLRPTELHDFSEVFGTPGSRTAWATAPAIIAGVIVLLLGTLASTGTTLVASNPAAPYAMPVVTAL